MKKYIALIFILLVLVTAVGCAKTAEEAEQTEQTGEETTPIEEYTPETVDTLTNDLNEMEW